MNILFFKVIRWRKKKFCIGWQDYTKSSGIWRGFLWGNFCNVSFPLSFRPPNFDTFRNGIPSWNFEFERLWSHNPRDNQGFGIDFLVQTIVVMYCVRVWVSDDLGFATLRRLNNMRHSSGLQGRSLYMYKKLTCPKNGELGGTERAFRNDKLNCS